MIRLQIRDGVRRLFRLALRRPQTARQDGEAEVESMLSERVDYLMARGASPEVARAEALRQLGGNLERARHEVGRSAARRERRLGIVETVGAAIGDARYALRTLRRSPSLAIAAITTLALAIGANATIYSAVEAVILRPLPFDQPERLVALWEENPDFNWHQQDAAPANYLDWKEQVSAFTDVAAYPSFGGPVTLTDGGRPRLLPAQSVTGNFFTVLGVRPFLGRGFTTTETWSSGGAPIAVISYRCWRDVFGADQSLVGRTAQFDGAPVTIVGVLPERFEFPGLNADVWRPVDWNPDDRAKTWFRRAHFVRTVARLKPGVTDQEANAALQVVVSRLQRDFPGTNIHMGAGLTPLHDMLIGKTRRPLLVLFGSVALLLLIACANVANLLLVRAATREREAALRLALGAGQGRVLRQALVDSLVLAFLGGAAGILVGVGGIRLLGALRPAGLLPIASLTMSWPVIWNAVAVTTFSALVFGIVPALWLGRRAPADVLRDEGRTATSGRRRGRLADAFLVSQVALALILTLGAGLLVRSYLLLQRVDPGFDANGVLATRVVLPDFRYDSVRKVRTFFHDLVEQSRALPGVEGAATTSKVPLGPSSWTSEFGIAGRPPMERGSEVVHREISADYHRVMRVPLLKGRYFTDADRGGAPAVVLINETLAKTYFAGEDPIGQRVVFDRVPDSTAHWRTIVGVVGDERQSGLGAPVQAEFFAPQDQEDRSGMTLLIRTRGNPAALESGVRSIVTRLDPMLAISSIQTMTDIRAGSLARERFLAALLVAFAGLGVVLGLVGISGVVAQLTRRRLREMAIRIALGARGGQVQWIVARRGLALTLLGIGIGTGVALIATRAIRSLLFQVAPADPVTFLLVPILTLVTAGIASWLPARRAGRADPNAVLRAD